MNYKWPVPGDRIWYAFIMHVSQGKRWEWSMQYAENGPGTTRITGHNEMGFLWMVAGQAQEEIRLNYQPIEVDGKKLLDNNNPFVFKLQTE
jgi:hypothetical protein